MSEKKNLNVFSVGFRTPRKRDEGKHPRSDYISLTVITYDWQRAMNLAEANVAKREDGPWSLESFSVETEQSVILDSEIR